MQRLCMKSFWHELPLDQWFPAGFASGPKLHIGQVVTRQSTAFCLLYKNVLKIKINHLFQGNKESWSLLSSISFFSLWFAIIASREDSSQSLASCLNLLPSPLEASIDRTLGREPREPPLRYLFLTGTSLRTFQFHRHTVNINALTGGIM